MQTHTHPHVPLNYLILRGVSILARISFDQGAAKLMSDEAAAALPSFTAASKVPVEFAEVALCYELSQPDLYALMRLSSATLRVAAQASTRPLYKPRFDISEMWVERHGVRSGSEDFDAADALLSQPTHKQTRATTIQRRILLAAFTGLWSAAKMDPFRTVAAYGLPVEDVKLLASLSWPRIERMTDSSNAGLSLADARETIAIIAQRTIIKAEPDLLPQVAAITVAMLK